MDFLTFEQIQGILCVLGGGLLLAVCRKFEAQRRERLQDLKYQVASAYSRGTKPESSTTWWGTALTVLGALLAIFGISMIWLHMK